jgi:hypothetical protein
MGNVQIGCQVPTAAAAAEAGLMKLQKMLYTTTTILDIKI